MWITWPAVYFQFLIFVFHSPSLRGNVQAEEVMSHPGFNQLDSAAAHKHSCSSRIDLASQQQQQRNVLYNRD